MHVFLNDDSNRAVLIIYIDVDIDIAMCNFKVIVVSFNKFKCQISYECYRSQFGQFKKRPHALLLFHKQPSFKITYKYLLRLCKVLHDEQWDFLGGWGINLNEPQMGTLSNPFEQPPRQKQGPSHNIYVPIRQPMTRQSF